ncbi:MAG: hypothetical protein AAF998_02905 [Bacteroidota bacterium]
MKRLWLFFALLVAGVGGYAYASTTNVLAIENFESPTNPTETERAILERAAPEFGIMYSELLSMFQYGEATITDLGDDTHEVAAISSDGVLTAVIIEGL